MEVLPREPDPDPRPATAEEHEKRSRDLAGKRVKLFLHQMPDKQRDSFQMAKFPPASGMGFRLATSGQYELAVKSFTDAISCNPKEFK